MKHTENETNTAEGKQRNKVITDYIKYTCDI